MSVTSWITKKVLAHKLPDVSSDVIDTITKLLEANPEIGTLFKKIGDEVEVRTQKGEHQMFATMEVMKKHQSQLREYAQKSPAAFAALQTVMQSQK
jgi:ribosomal protein L14E/L6E/L27E